MSTRPSRSANIPISTGQAVYAARSLEDAITIPFTRPSPPGAAPRARRSSTISRSPDNRPRGPSTSPVRSSIAMSTSPAVWPLAGSYSSAVSQSALGRGLPHQRPSLGGHPSSPTNPAPPSFQPRIIRAASSPNPSRDPAACLPIPPVPILSSSPTRPRRLSAGIRSGNTPSAPRISASLPASSHMQSPLSHSVPTPINPAGIPHTQAQGQAFLRPAYLEYSALRDFLHTDAAPILPFVRNVVASPHPHQHSQPVSYAPPPAPRPYPYLRRSLTPVLDSDSEGTQSPSPPPHGRAAQAVGAISVLSANPVLRLPTRWSEQDRNPSLSVSPDGCELTFCGSSCAGDRDACAARANCPIPRACGIYYYEVEILQIQRGKGHISIGFSAENVRLSRLPGWEPLSWGYHADDGRSFSGQKDGNPYGPEFVSGDVIGCGIDFSQNRAFYTRNGEFLGMVFDNLPPASVALYPAIGLRHTSEAVRANFGAVPFRFAIADHVRAQRDAVWAGIMNVPKGKDNGDSEDVSKQEGGVGLGSRDSPKEDVETRTTLQKLVMSYLAHHGYEGTARAFRAQCTNEGLGVPASSTSAAVKREDVEVAMETDDGPQASSSKSAWGASVSAGASDLDPTNPESQDFKTRVAILQAVRAGDIDVALDSLASHYPQALEAQGGLLLFRLRCRKFVELVLKAGEALRRVKEAEAEMGKQKRGSGARDEEGEWAMVGEVGVKGDDMDGEGAMEVDDPSPEALALSTVRASSVSGSTDVSTTATMTPAAPTLADLAKSALHTALSYGQGLETEYKTDTRPVVRTHLRRTFGLVAYDDPERAGGEVGAMAGQEARVQLAEEVNQAILESQDRPVHPALETLFRQSGACVVQLGLLGVGAAAFADVRQEFIES